MLNKMIEENIETLVHSMTLEEKVSLIHGNGLFRTEGIPRLSIPPLKMSDGPMGVRNEFPDDSWVPFGYTNDYVTYFPSNMALASTWNTSLAYEFGEALGDETRGRGKDVILGPGINIVRSPLCGRNFEYMSEDPYLISQLVSPFIAGIQTKDVAACVKHLAVNNQETNRLTVDVQVDERALQEIYLPGFKAAVEIGDAYSVMGAYNKLRGAFCCENSYLLQDILKNQWGFDGVVISDWGAVHHTEAAAISGLDIEMNVTFNFDDYFLAAPLIEKIKAGHIEEVVVDEKVMRILRLMHKLKMFSPDRNKGQYNLPKHRETALKIAREAVVLLKNNAKTLPLDPSKMTSIAVIGENANRIHSNGGGSAEIKALYEISPLLGLHMLLGGNTTISYFPGYSSDPTLDKKACLALRDSAIEAAKTHDTVLFFSGLNHDLDAEGKDKPDLKLPYGQDALILDVLAANPKTVIANISGTPVDMEAWIDVAPAVIQSWYQGMEGGYALAEVLFGVTNPSGKLPVTFPKKLEDCSAHSIGEFPGGDIVNYTESIFVGYRHFDSSNIEPRFAFGHGLSYSSFNYSDLNILKINDQAYKVSFMLRNTSKVDGCETVQLYLTDCDSSLPRPAQELKGFSKVFLKAGSSQVVEFNLDSTHLSFYHDGLNQWICESGAFDLSLGSSSRDIRLKGQFMI